MEGLQHQPTDREPDWSWTPPSDYDHQEEISSSLLDNVRDTLDMRIALDLSVRGLYDTVREEPAGVSTIGLDMYKTFSSASGDWGTFIGQFYLTRIDNLAGAPPFFEDDDDLELVTRIFNFNYTGLNRGVTNFRIGHFEIPFGLEHLINTNGTLRDYMHGRNIGVKADWGIGVNGLLSEAEYEVTLSRGTGIDYFDRSDPYIFAGRIGTDRTQDTVWGISAMQGKVFSPGSVAFWRIGTTNPASQPNARSLVERSRVGVDFQHYFESWGVLAEASYGQDFDQVVVNVLAELDWTTPAEDWLLYTQGRGFFQDFDAGWVDATSAAVGVRWTPDNNWAWSAQAVQEITNFAHGRKSTTFALQGRYRF